MRWVFVIFFAFFLPSLATSQSIDNKVFVSWNNEDIQYEGRIGTKNPEAAEFYWSGTTVRINFKGGQIEALLDDELGQNIYNVILDNKTIYKLKMNKGKQPYLLAKDLSSGKHTVELFKITQVNKEYKRGFTRFYGFQLAGDGKVLNPTKAKKRKIEFYGNSVTCGHAIEDNTGGDSGAPKYENNYLSYAATTARHYNAQYSCIAKSGIGMTVSWGWQIMPEMYNLTNPLDSASTWNFSKYTPDIVVVNLFQNDAGIVPRPELAQFKRRFGTTIPDEAFLIKSYQNFIQNLRNQYPQASIICTLGSMAGTKEGSLWPEYIKKAVANLGDKKVYTHFFAYKNTPGHPRVWEQKIMAQSLIRFIDKNVKW